MVSICEPVKASFAILKKLGDSHDSRSIVQSEARMLLAVMHFDDVAKDGHKREEELKEGCPCDENRRAENPRRQFVLRNNVEVLPDSFWQWR
jgi:hypothetical protein